MSAQKTFGEYLRMCRLKTGYGLRSFAVAIEMKPSNLSNTEHGRTPPPQDPKKLAEIAEVLGIQRGSDEWSQLHDLAVKDKEGAIPPDVRETVSQSTYIPVLLRAIDDKKLTAEEILELTEHVEKHFGQTDES